MQRSFVKTNPVVGEMQTGDARTKRCVRSLEKKRKMPTLDRLNRDSAFKIAKNMQRCVAVTTSHSRSFCASTLD